MSDAQGLVRIDSLFQVRSGNGLVLSEMKIVEWPDGVNFVARASGMNGVVARVQPPENEAVWEPGNLSVAVSGSVLSTFVQPDPFVTAFHVDVLIPLTPMSLAEKLWRATCIEANKYRYNYGRQANRTLASLMVPGEMPEWVEAVPRGAVTAFGRRVQEIGDDFGEPSGLEKTADLMTKLFQVSPDEIKN